MEQYLIDTNVVSDYPVCKCDYQGRVYKHIATVYNPYGVYKFSISLL